ncbi:unnamed protein product [Microthlaspi erraticum]|uniref:DNA-directed RNA polymerase III subunit RPC5 n=1 Tax=Microthlaspi erraticum TaxID=1685480 RepID=A0A6D2L134_9BRAS|nr:unnamed protein product [Microthlaspi erraticum]
MDFDEDDKPKVVSKPRRFAPKPKPKPKTEPTAPPSQSDALSESVSKSEHDFDGKFAVSKVEPELYNGSVKMEIEKTEAAELMEVDKEEEEEEDVVVREIDVYLNPSIDDNTKLYVLQCPLRPSWRPYEMDERCQQVRVNPCTSEVQVDLSMDVNSTNYDSNFGSELNMTTQTLTTTWKPPPTSDYAVGVLSGDKLHLNPVHAVAQLRPSMHYLKKQTEATQESVGTSKKQNKGVQDQKPIPEQNWVALKYHGQESELCSKYLNGMMANEDSSIDFDMSPEAYINSLCRGETSRNEESSKSVLTSLPLEERVRKLLLQGPWLFRYSLLKHYAPEVSDERFLSVLQQYACLVQGLWTPKTKILKLELVTPKLAAFRDYVLALFNKGLTIKFFDVKAAESMVDEEERKTTKSMLAKLAKERPLFCDWKFKEPTDVSFLKSFPEIANEQASLWQEVEKKLKPQGKKSKADNVAGENPCATSKPEVPTSLSNNGASSRNTTIPCLVRQEMSEDVKSAITKALEKVFRTHKVCSYKTICQGLRDLAVSTSNNPKADSGMAQQVALAVDAHEEELKEVISSVAVDIHGSFVSKSSPDHPEDDRLREVVIELLRGVGDEAGKKLKKSHVIEAAMIRLGRKITGNEYIKVMHDLCETSSSGWVLRKAR